MADGQNSPKKQVKLHKSVIVVYSCILKYVLIGLDKRREFVLQALNGLEGVVDYVG